MRNVRIRFKEDEKKQQKNVKKKKKKTGSRFNPCKKKNKKKVGFLSIFLEKNKLIIKPTVFIFVCGKKSYNVNVFQS